MLVRSTLLVPLICIWLAGCGPALPKLPEIDFARFPPAVRAAIEEAHSAAELAPQDAQNAAELAKTLHAHQLWDAALPFYAHARQQDPQNATYAHLRGVAMFERGQYAEALLELDKALALRPGSQATQYWMAETLVASGSLIRAAEIYRTLGDTAIAHYGLGRTLKSSEALAQYQRAVELEPRFGAAWKAISQLAQQAGDQALAEEAGRAADLHRHEAPVFDDAEMFSVRDKAVSADGIAERAWRAEVKNQLLEASRFYDQLTALQPENIGAWTKMIGIQVRLKDFASAEKACINLRRSVGENHAEVEAVYGRLLIDTKRPAGKEPLEKAVKLNPYQADAWVSLGRLEDGAKAAEYFRRAVVSDAGSREARYHYARALMKQGKKAEAAPHVKFLLEGPEDEWKAAAREL